MEIGLHKLPKPLLRHGSGSSNRNGKTLRCHAPALVVSVPLGVCFPEATGHASLSCTLRLSRRCGALC
eukprot:12912599-Prorocentrum_lima.AAC.1